MKTEVNEIVQLIIEYTRQVEKYENVSTYYSAICLGGIWGTALFIIYLLVRRQKESVQEIYDKAISTLCLLPPVITTLYLYTFALNMRKVAMFRGYLGYLENLRNSLADYPVMAFDQELITQFLGAKCFPVNGWGPAVMGIFVILSLVIGFRLSAYFDTDINADVMIALAKEQGGYDAVNQDYDRGKYLEFVYEELHEQILDKGIINEESKYLIYEDLRDWCADMP